MKCLILAPKRYPFIHSLEKEMVRQDIEVCVVDYTDFFSKHINRFVKKYTSLPRKIKRHWEEPHENRINQSYAEICKNYEPDIVLIYNNQLASPDFLRTIKKTSKIVFLLGDHPLYTPTSLTNLHILFFADYVICPDSMWAEQLTRMGVKNVVQDYVSFSEEIYFPMKVSEEEHEEYGSDCVFIGTGQKINWGYKRMLYLSLFREFDLKIYLSGSGMRRWYKYFPDTATRIIPYDHYSSTFNNLLYNCSKVTPVDLVPSLFNGIHARVFDAIGAGILPMCEYSSDLEHFFEGIAIPLIRNYDEATDFTRYWISHDLERKDLVSKLRDRIAREHSPQKVINRMMDRIFSQASVNSTKTRIKNIAVSN